ncbi:hypothetical protein [uncultured Hyphomicrobium sp.]|nr:hypothetical protein [uncultured Hyphomicrobium sp.]
MALVSLVVLIVGAFAIAVYASEKRFGEPRRKIGRKSDRDG